MQINVNTYSSWAKLFECSSIQGSQESLKPDNLPQDHTPCHSWAFNDDQSTIDELTHISTGESPQTNIQSVSDTLKPGGNPVISVIPTSNSDILLEPSSKENETPSISVRRCSTHEHLKASRQQSQPVPRINKCTDSARDFNKSLSVPPHGTQCDHTECQQLHGCKWEHDGMDDTIHSSDCYHGTHSAHGSSTWSNYGLGGTGNQWDDGDSMHIICDDGENGLATLMCHCTRGHSNHYISGHRHSNLSIALGSRNPSIGGDSIATIATDSLKFTGAIKQFNQVRVFL